MRVATAHMIGKITAVANNITAFMTFTLPLGKLLLDLQETLVTFISLAITLSVATAVLPLACFYHKTLFEWYEDAWNKAITASA